MLHVAAELYILRLYFFFLSFHCSAPNNKSSIVSSNCHFLHRLPFTLTLDTLFLASSHQCWCEFTGESKGWESQWGNKLLLLCCLPEGRSAFYWWTSSWAQKSVRSLRKDTQYTHKHTCKHTFVHKRTHKMENTIVETVEIHTDRIMHKYTSLVVYSHIVFFHPAVFFFFIQTMWPLHCITTNHMCRSWRRVRKNNGESELNLLFDHICAALGSNEEVLLLILW